jgi:3-phosphoshikimate 1-carboxyvinyltransferase
LDRIELESGGVLKGELAPPPDKSISHRAVMFASLARGTSRLRNVLRAKDTESTARAFSALGVDIEDRGEAFIVHGKGLRGLSEPSDVIDCGNSGTTIRLISGVLSGNDFFSVLTGDASLRTRPMARVIRPLGLMGADIRGRSGDKYPPLAIRGGGLKAIEYAMPMASAQVKSSLLLAGLYADGKTVVAEPAQSRDHTERMLPALGAAVEVEGLTVTISGGSELSPAEIVVPGDFSSAAFFIVAALISPESEITIRNVGINPTRTGLLRVLETMGARVEISERRDVSGEPVADLYCKSCSNLKATEVTKEMVPSLIDEFPILCVAAAVADGTTTIRGAEELRVKESDRIAAMASELRKLGCDIEEYPDGLSIVGRAHLRGASVDSHGDHRIAMSMAVASLRATGRTTITGASAVDISFPGFFDIMSRLRS